MPRVCAPVTERIRKAVVITDAGCWEWQRSKNEAGYGAMQVGSWQDGSRRMMQAHRASYEAFVGPIPDGLQIDHLCRVRACVNPDHLEPVTAQVNSERRTLHQRIEDAAADGRRMCERGHEQTSRTTLYVKGLPTCGPCAGRIR